MDVNKVKAIAADLVESIKNDRKIDAIKNIRAIAGCGLVEAKEITEAFMKAYGKLDPLSPPKDAEFVVVTRTEYDTFSNTYYHEDVAMDYAATANNDPCNSTVIVAKVIAKTVTTRSLKRI
jgi:hypothetical protein